MVDTLNALHAERAPLAARLDAIELAEKHLQHIWAPDDAPDRRRAPRRQVPGRRKAPRGKTGRPVKTAPTRTAIKRAQLKAQGSGPACPADAGHLSEAAVRRQQLLELIRKSEVGLTIADLRKAMPKMDDKDRSNAVQLLKASGEIRRVGNTWVKGR